MHVLQTFSAINLTYHVKQFQRIMYEAKHNAFDILELLVG